MIHGKTLGGDVKAVVNGGALVIEAISIKKMSIASEFSVIVVDTGIRAKTSDTVAAVRAQYEQGEGKVIIDKIGVLTEEIIQLIVSADIVHDTGFHTKVAQNHQLLCDLGLGIVQVQEVIAILDSHGIAGKMSGKGRGGIVIGFVESEISAQTVLADLHAQNYKAWIPEVDQEGIYCCVEDE